MRHPKHQSGTVLIVVIMLLLLASVLSFFALNVGVFEQRTSGNDVKTKIVGEVAEAGLTQGMEYLHQHYTYFTDTSKWTQCLATATSFPCGSVEPGVANSTRRSTMYYWSSGGYDFDGNGSISGWEQRMLPLPSSNVVTTGTTVAGTNYGTNYTVQYGVGAVLCRLATKTTTASATTCTDSASATNASIVTFVSTASIPSEGAKSTVVQSFGAHNIIGNLPSTPPIVASGSINLVGTIQIVTNPNSGGTGVPVSLWTPQSLNGNGTGNSCYANEFYASGTVDWSHVATLPTFPLCDNCSCNGSLSYAHGNTVSNGIDSLSADDNSAGGGNGAVHVDADQTKTEFPCDLFQQIFGVQAWSDTSPVDGFCETHIMTTYTNPNNTSQIVTMGVDEAYLYTYAGYIKANASRTYTCVSGCTTLTAAALRNTVASGTQPDQTAAKNYGLVWCQDGSVCERGTADTPVLMVFDGGSDGGSPNLTIGGNIYGMVFGRSTGKATSGVLTKSTGGDASFSMSSNAVVYGSIVLQGTTGHLNGTSAVVYNKDILTNLANSDAFVKFGGMPGSWSDRLSY
jgi:Tfp pilus assembly protein PilX